MDQPAKTRTRIPRHAAGADPDKRAAILRGAAEVFLRSGFDAASVNAICEAAGVSKSTLYVYFSDKEDLFAQLVADERERLFAGLQQSLRGPAPLADRLVAFAETLAEIVCSDQVIQAQRIVIGIAERRPDLGASFYEGGASRGQAVLLDTLQREIAAGRLAIPDPALAAAQLVELATAGLWRRRLFGKAAAPPSPEQVRTTAASAVAMFIAAYGCRDAGSEADANGNSEGATPC